MKILFIGALAVFMPFAVSAFAENLQVAENVLLYQLETGGWPKNYERKQELTDAQRLRVFSGKSKNDSMIDNGATHTEIQIGESTE
jgi:hypothetical protein